MCGIIGYVGQKNASEVILNALKHLEYRGYDSSGVALFCKQSQKLIIEKKLGSINELSNHLHTLNIQSNSGIGHTRWATHGKPSIENAHPLKYNKVSVVHNGIIENYQTLKRNLVSLGHSFTSDTDTEVIAHLLDDLLLKTDPLPAIKELCNLLTGAYALGISIEECPDKIFFAKNKCPLIIAKDSQGVYLASDELALMDFSVEVYSLIDGQFGYVSLEQLKVCSLNGVTTDIRLEKTSVNKSSMSLLGHKHYMHKEIFEQPLAIKRLLDEKIIDNKVYLNPAEINLDKADNFTNIQIVACGSSYIAGLIAKDFMESLLNIPTQVDFASEYRYGHNLTHKNTLLIVISQSGETADTLAALEEGASKGAKYLAITNIASSAIARFCKQSLGNIFLNAGIEVSVASTKAFVSQVVALKILSIALAAKKSLISKSQEEFYIEGLKGLPAQVQNILSQDEQIRSVADKLKSQSSMLYIARGNLYPIALEGALKMKELSYIAAQGYPAGELKHGPIATIDKDMAVVVIFNNDELSVKTMSNLCEVKARGAKIIAVATNHNKDIYREADYFIELVNTENFLQPIIATIPLQLLAYHLSDLKGLDVDKPRNLAKSVTVE